MNPDQPVKISFLITMVMVFLLYSPFAFAQSKSKEPQVIESLSWGEVLYYQFKGDKTEALIRLLAREKQNSLSPHASDASLMAAALLLDLGMAQKAKERLVNLKNGELDDRLASKFSLAMARLYYLNQDYVQTADWLEKSDDELLLGDELNQKKLIKAQLLFHAGQFAAAAEEFKNIDTDSNLQYYALYNQGLTLLNSEHEHHQRTAIALLTTLTQLEPQDQEQYALIDQAKLTLAIQALNSGDQNEARKQLFNMRLDGLLSNDALLILGWSFQQNNDYSSALSYWSQLASKNLLLEPSVQEAWLAIPYAYQQLGDKRQALLQYQKALSLQEQAKDLLDLLSQNQAWKELLSEGQSSSTADLDVNFKRQLIADPTFYQSLENWRELNQLHMKLAKSMEILPTLQLVLSENKNRYTNKVTSISNHLSSEDYSQFTKKYNELLNLYETQKDKTIAEAFLPASDFKNWQKIDSAKQLATQLTVEIDSDKREQIRRLDGVAKWKFHRQRNKDEYRAKSSINQLQKQLELMSTQLTNLSSLTNTPHKSITTELEQVNRLLTRWQLIESDLTKLQTQLEAEMSAQFSVFINRRKKALDNLGEQANLAIARLQFQALEATSDHE